MFTDIYDVSNNVLNFFLQTILGPNVESHPRLYHSHRWRTKEDARVLYYKFILLGFVGFLYVSAFLSASIDAPLSGTD